MILIHDLEALVYFLLLLFFIIGIVSAAWRCGDRLAAMQYQRRVRELTEANNRYLERAREAEAEAEELNRLFDLQHRRSMEAIKLWRKAHLGNDLVQPDLGKLLEWLLGFCTPRSEKEWHEDFGPVLWLRSAEGEPPEVYAGTPLDHRTWTDFTAEDGYHSAPVWVHLPDHRLVKEVADVEA